MPERIISLICNPNNPALSDVREKVDKTLRALDLFVQHSRELADNVAWEARVDTQTTQGNGYTDEQIREAIIAAIGGAPIDVNLLPSDLSNGIRRKDLLVADMDSTIIEQECIDEIADFAGIKSEVADITKRTMRGELDLETSLRKRVGLLKGLSSSVLQKIVDERLTLTPGAQTLSATMKANGARLVLASSGFTFFTDRIAKKVGFHEAHSNTLGIANDKLTGEINGPIYGGADKARTLLSVRDALSIAPESTMAVGDGANDLVMIAEANTGVAFRAKPAVAKAADCNINHGDLTGLLFLQGYALSEFHGALNLE
ncbi:MAG: phosphoserine phosphatase SerB [Pseudomonadota bacterium]